jgi:hypothetical protein
MQGRLIPNYRRIKYRLSLPNNWENEIKEANNIGFSLMEWTLDYEWPS